MGAQNSIIEIEGSVSEPEARKAFRTARARSYRDTHVVDGHDVVMKGILHKALARRREGDADEALPLAVQGHLRHQFHQM